MTFEEIFRRLSLCSEVLDSLPVGVPAADVRDFIDSYVDLPRVALDYKISNLDLLREVLVHQINTTLITDGYAYVFPPFTKDGHSATYVLRNKNLEGRGVVEKYIVERKK